MNDYLEEEILRVSDQLGRSGHYGAAQMICGLARERDAARQDAKDARALLRECSDAGSYLSDGYKALWLNKHPIRDLAEREAHWESLRARIAKEIGP